MVRIASSFAFLAGALFAFGLGAVPARAQAARTFVSGHGTDSGACSLGAPCRTFAFAIGQTTAGGEIDVLDPAGYGAVTIAQAISIVNDGVGVAGVQAPAGMTGVTINAGANDIVRLRGLTIEGAGVASVGIQFNSGASLDIVNCVVRISRNTVFFFSRARRASFRYRIRLRPTMRMRGSSCVQPEPQPSKA